MQKKSVHLAETVTTAMCLCAVMAEQHAAAETTKPTSRNACLPACTCAVVLLRRTHPSVLDDYRPVRVAADSNCLYCPVLVLLYGTERHHGIVRLQTAAEVLTHAQYYDIQRPDCQCPFKDEKFLFLPTYYKLCEDTAPMLTSRFCTSSVGPSVGKCSRFIHS